MENKNENVLLQNEITGDSDKIVKEELTLFDQVVEIGRTHKKTGALPDSGFEKFAESIAPGIKTVCKKLELNELQTVLFSDMVNLYDGKSIGLKNLAEFIGCDLLSVIKYIDEFRAIEDKNLIQINDPSISDVFETELCFKIGLETLADLKKNLPQNNNIKNLSIDDFLTQVTKLCENRVQKNSSYRKTIRNMADLLRNNSHLGLVKVLKSYNLPDDAELMLLRFCHYLIDLDTGEMDYNYLRALYDNYSEFRQIKQQLKSGGQIENIARRKTVAEVLHGFSPSLEALVEYCKEEKLDTNDTKRIGFCS